MSIISKILSIISIIAILHSALSSYEFNQLSKNLSQNSVYTQLLVLPHDIKYEACGGLILFILAQFLAFEKIEFYPLRKTDGKKLEPLSQGKYLKYIALHKATNVDNLMNSDPTGDISYTSNMINIHDKRKIMKEWLLKNNK